MAEINEIQVGQDVFNIGGSGGGVNYSTTEQDTGLKWINGKPIYQKTISTTFASTAKSWKTEPHNISNIETVINYFGYVLNDQDISVSLNCSPSISSTVVTIVGKSDVNFYVDGYTRVLSRPTVVTMQYTKTTD